MIKSDFDMIKVFQPYLSINDKLSVMKSLLKNQISGTSPIVETFENQISKKFDRKYGVAVSNGSVALDIALKTLNLNKDDEVIIPSFTIISCLSAVVRSGATPVFCDVDKDTWNMTLKELKKNITKKTKAIVIVHTYGLTAEAIAISEYCKNNKLILIEDAAESHGQKIENIHCGSFGLISTLSFYANKHITTGEGGILLTDDKTIYELVKDMRNLDFNSKHRFNHNNFYWNYRLGGLQASLGISQLQNLDKTINKKINQGEYYQKLLEPYVDLIQLPLKKDGNTINHYWVFGVVLNADGIRDRVMGKLKEKEIETRPFFWPLHLQNALKKTPFEKQPTLKESERLGRNGLYLPMGSHISKKKQRFIVHVLINAIKELVT